MKKNTLFLIFTIFILLTGYFSFRLNTGKLYDDYKKLWEFRILHPEVLPDTDIVRFTVAGNTTSYADKLWMELIQYIGDNISNNEYHKFLNPLIEKITELHPHFTETYNIALLLAPNMNPEKPDFESRKKLNEQALKLGEIGLEKNCDADKLRQIYDHEFSSSLWSTEELKNPCNDSMIAYNLAITANELSDFKKAKEYFKISTLAEEGPLAARFLGPLMDAKQGDNKNAGERFLLIAIGAYDEAPYLCQKSAGELIKLYKTEPFPTVIDQLRNIEESLSKPKDLSNPIATTDNTCYGFITRGMKQFYLAYFNEITEKYPEILTGTGIIEKGLLKKIPTIRAQDGWGLIKKNGEWRYTE